MFDLPDSWVWDFWFADDGDRYHLFFLYASKALHDPDARHARASIGHAVSSDLVDWTRVADALVRDDAPAFDDVATWTGSVLRGADGIWRMFYTGLQFDPADGRGVQRIGVVTSVDLMRWERARGTPVLEADPRWYERLADSEWEDEAWRDPWVFADPDGDGWHMLVTARAASGAIMGRGVVGHAVSDDLDTWTVREPLSDESDDGFAHLEVMQVEEVYGRPVLIFSCAPAEAADSRRQRFPRAAIWAAPTDSLTGPYRIEEAYPLSDDDLYVGRLIKRRDDGRWHLLAFHYLSPTGRFLGGVTDPIPVRWNGDRLELCD